MVTTPIPSRNVLSNIHRRIEQSSRVVSEGIENVSMAKRHLTVRVRASIISKIEELAEGEEDCNRSDLVRRALDEFVDDDEGGE